MFQDTTPFVLALVITFAVLVCISIWNSMNSKPPYEKKPEPEPGPSRTREILARFSQFYLNLNPEDGFIYDTAILPDPKQHIIHALYVGFDESETEADREAIERGLRAIINFQDLVGEEPLVPVKKDDSVLETNISPQNLFPEEELVSEEEKKYNEYSSKRDLELFDHFNHLKIDYVDDKSQVVEEEK